MKKNKPLAEMNRRIIANLHAQIINDFTKTLTDYRKLIVDNFRGRMGDEDDTKPLEKSMIDQFKSCPSKIRVHLLFLLLKIIAAPNKNEASERLDSWLQSLAFERLTELEKSVQ